MVEVVAVPILAGLALLLAWITAEPWITHWVRRFGRAPVTLPEPATAESAALYRSILVPLDHTDLDQPAVAHAATMAHGSGARLYLLHVEEGVTSQVYGDLASTAEVEAGARYLERIAESLRSQGLEVETEIRHSLNPRREIVRYARQIQPDLLVMGAHGHRRLKDLIFGNTIDPVRHELKVPILIVRRPG